LQLFQAQLGSTWYYLWPVLCAVLLFMAAHLAV